MLNFVSKCKNFKRTLDLKRRRKETNAMQFIAAQDFKFTSRKISKRLSEDGKMVVTKNGKPTALIFDLKNIDLEQTLNEWHKIQMLRALENIWTHTAKTPPISDEEIEAEIQAVRAERKAKQAARL